MKRTLDFILENTNICPSVKIDLQVKVDEETRTEFNITEPVHIWGCYHIGDANAESLLKETGYDTVEELFVDMDNYYSSKLDEIYSDFVSDFKGVIDHEGLYYATSLEIILSSKKELCVKREVESKYEGLVCFELQDCQDIIRDYLNDNLEYKQYNRSFSLDRRTGECYSLDHNQFLPNYDDTFDIEFHRESTSNYGNWFDFSDWIAENRDWEYLLKDYLEDFFEEKDEEIQEWANNNLEDWDNDYADKLEWFKYNYDFNEKLDIFEDICSDFIEEFNDNSKSEAIDRCIKEINDFAG